MFPVVDLNGELIPGKEFIWGLAVMNYLELVAVVGTIISVMDALVDMTTNSFPLIQVLEVVAYFIIIRVEDQTSTLFVLSMFAIGIGIILRSVLNIGLLGFPALFESQENFKIRLETNSAYKFFIPSSTPEGSLSEKVVLDIRQSIFFLVIRSVIVVVIASLLFRFIERARELKKYDKLRKARSEDLEAGELPDTKGKSSTTTGPTAPLLHPSQLRNHK